MRYVVIALLVVFVLLGTHAVADEKEAPKSFLPHTPAEWLVIAPVDHRARRPFNPDAVFARYLLDPAAPAPVEGQRLSGERAKEEAWKKQQADDKGRVGGGIAWAYAAVESPRDQVVMAWLKSGGTLFVNGTPHAGAIYGDRFEVPVALVQGTNHVYVKGVRGAFELTFSAPPADVFLAPFRQTKPDLVAGEACDTVAGLLIVNALKTPLGTVRWHVKGNDWLQEARAEGVLPIAPLSMVQVRVPLKTKPGKTAPTEPGKVAIPIEVGAYTGAFDLEVREKAKALIRTFVSNIDDSVQRFGVREPVPDPKKRARGLVLSLHGAGVNPRGQARSYAPKPDFWLFAPTNRGRFGFDWQDWGRLDAYEVLEEGLRISAVDRSRVYLTGHSMGGHGTWHLAANDPDGFAAIAPSAGWISFDTYPRPRREGELTPIWHAADGASKTRDLLSNLAQLPTFILHGEKDDNVPVAQAKEMEKLLTEAGAKPQVHYEPGKKHWWDGHPEPGVQCVDWPGIYTLFGNSVIPKAPKTIEFTGVDPSVDARHHWIEVLQLMRYGKPFTVRAEWDAANQRFEVQPENVQRLRIYYPGPRSKVEIEGGTMTMAAAEPSPTSEVWERRSVTQWQPVRAGPSPGEKSPRAGGPFKRAFTNRFVLVYGTHGTPEEERALLDEARFDAQRWTYRGNGQSVLLTDKQWLGLAKPLDLAKRNTVIYGNRDTNAAFRILARGEPVTRKAVYHSALKRGDDIAACYVGPGPRPGTLVGFCASTGIPGSRLGFVTMKFVSGAGWPDYVFFDSGILSKGDGGVFEAGWYDRRWSIQKDGFLREED